MLKTILPNIITTIGAFILVYLSVIKEIFVTKNSLIRERLDKFYFPFYSLYCKNLISKVPLFEHNADVRLAFIELMADNVHYMSPNAQALFPDFFAVNIKLTTTPRLDESSRSIVFAVFENFFDITIADYKKLLKKAKLPVPKI